MSVIISPNACTGYNVSLTKYLYWEMNAKQELIQNCLWQWLKYFCMWSIPRLILHINKVNYVYNGLLIPSKENVTNSHLLEGHSASV